MSPAFGGKVHGQTFGTTTTSRPRFNLFTLEQDLADAHCRLAATTIEHLDWKEAVRRYDRPHTLFYCDPPYWGVEGYGTEFAWEEYEELRRISGTLQGKMILSINAHPEIRKLFTGLAVVEVGYKYTVGDLGKVKGGVELIYTTWQPPAGEPG